MAAAVPFLAALTQHSLIPLVSGGLRLSSVREGFNPRPTTKMVSCYARGLPNQDWWLDHELGAEERLAHQQTTWSREAVVYIRLPSTAVVVFVCLPLHTALVLARSSA